MIMGKKHYFLYFFLLISATAFAQTKKELSLMNDNIRVLWEQDTRGWYIKTFTVKKGQQWVSAGNPSGENTLLYAPEKPGSEPDTVFKTITGVAFPEPHYKYQIKQWAESTNPVSLNTAGKAYHFFPKNGHQKSKNSVRFTHDTEVGSVLTEWSFDEKFPTDIIVSQTLSVKQVGHYSLASPTPVVVPEKNMAWATVPGYFQGNAIQKNFVLAYAYGHGVPDLPVIYRERCASTLSPMVTTDNGITYSVIPEPGLARDPWEKDKITQVDWSLGLSHKNRRSELSPTIYYPVLGEPKSALKPGDKISFNFRYSVTDGDWFKALNHAVYDIYRFGESVAIRQSSQSLTSRIENMHTYLTDPVTSMWNVKEFNNMKIGAQSYLGGVVGSDKDAMKNSDYGAMWMLARATNDSVLNEDRLPYALNFKLAQQQTEDGFFKGAAVGQYYLSKSRKFVEEWGAVVEPIGLTYYTMLDMGNILLFEPGNATLRERLRIGAESLLKLQRADGSWAVAYDRKTEAEIFKDIRDLRPTFYGLIVAHRILKDEKYLAAAKRGADWQVENAVKTGSFLGVCGDARYAPDFATGQTAQAFLDLYEITKDEKYKAAAITSAKIYTTSVYTHPIPSREKKMVNGVQKEDWEIAQSGLSFEHGGIFGSATRHGPIMLASHAGLFLRIYQLTKEPILLDMARSAAIGLDAFVDPKTSVASYYWHTMNRGAGPYPHHAWWQVGWITDYIMSEADLRSEGRISFPRGFVTPKVGPHQTYGFENGKVFDESARLVNAKDFLNCDKPQVDYIVAKSAKGNKVFIVFLNNDADAITTNIKWTGKSKVFKKVTIRDEKGKVIVSKNISPDISLSLNSYGLKLMVLE